MVLIAVFLRCESLILLLVIQKQYVLLCDAYSWSMDVSRELVNFVSIINRSRSSNPSVREIDLWCPVACIIHIRQPFSYRKKYATLISSSLLKIHEWAVGAANLKESNWQVTGLCAYSATFGERGASFSSLSTMLQPSYNHGANR